MKREVRWERMFPDELDAALAECPVCYLTCGLCEPHGPQNVLGMDALRAHGFACHAARKYGGIVAPPFFWNVHELGIYAVWAHKTIGEQRPWLTALPPWMFFKSLYYQVRAADAMGFHAILMYTGHSGPHAQDLPTLEAVLQPHVSARIAFLTDGAFPVWENSGHGGKVETSMLWALEPDCVDLSRLPAADAPGPHFAMGSDAAEASRRLGEEIVTKVADGLGARAAELLEAYDRLRPTQQPLTFEDIERIWEAEVRPHLKGCASMQDLSAGQEPPPEDSRWYPQWRVPDRG